MDLLTTTLQFKNNEIVNLNVIDATLDELNIANA